MAEEVFTWFDFLTLFIGSIGLTLILLLLFSLLHGTEFFKRLHASRMYNGDDVDCPIKPLGNPFAWLVPVCTASEEDLIKAAGLDAVVFIRMFTFSIQLFCILNVLCLPVLLPLHATKDGIEVVTADNTTAQVDMSHSVDALGASLYSKNDSRLWGVFSMLYVITAVTCFLLWRNYKHMWSLRHKFLASRSRALHADEYTLLVTDIPDLPSSRGDDSTLELVHTRGKSVKVPKHYIRKCFTFLRIATVGLVKTPSKALRSDIFTAKSEQVDAYFGKLYPGHYLTNQGVLASNQAQSAYKKWKTAVRNLKRARWRLEKLKEQNHTSENPSPDEDLILVQRTGFCGCWGKRVDTIHYWEDKVRNCTRILENKQAQGRRATGSAFVCFNSRRVAAVAAQTSHSVKGNRWRLEKAPEPRDVIWRNVELRSWEKTLRSHLGLALTVLLIVFFYAPVAATAGLTSLTTLVGIWPALGYLAENKWFKGMASSVLASLSLRIMLWIVPPILLLLARLEGYTSESEAERVAAVKHFYVLLFNVFIGYSFTDTFVKSLELIYQNPSQVMTILGNIIPTTSSFFISYVVISGVLFFVELLRFPIPFFRYLFVRMTVEKEIADREKSWSLGQIAYHVFVPYQNLVITFGLVFAVLAPLILPFVLLYSLIGTMVWRHQVMYCYSEPYQTGGLMWPHFVNHVFVALIIAQLTATGVLTTKGAYIQAAWCPPLIILTIYCWLTVNARYRATFRVLPLELACEVDEMNERDGLIPVASDFAGQYVPKCLGKFTNPDSCTVSDESDCNGTSHERADPSNDEESPRNGKVGEEEMERCRLAGEDEKEIKDKRSRSKGPFGCNFYSRRGTEGEEKEDENTHVELCTCIDDACGEITEGKGTEGSGYATVNTTDIQNGHDEKAGFQHH